MDCGGSPHSAPLPSSGRVALGHDTLSYLLHGSFQGLWGLWVCCFLPVSCGIWPVQPGGGLGFVEPLPQLQPAGPPAPGLLHHPGLYAPPGSHNLLICEIRCSLWGLGNLEQFDLSPNWLTEQGTARLGASSVYTGSCQLETATCGLATIPGLEVLSGWE